jgi:hypothetical protein
MIAVSQSLSRSGRFTFWDGVGSILYIPADHAVLPSMIEQSEELDKLMDAYPKEMMQAFMAAMSKT